MVPCLILNFYPQNIIVLGVRPSFTLCSFGTEPYPCVFRVSFWGLSHFKIRNGFPFYYSQNRIVSKNQTDFHFFCKKRKIHYNEASLSRMVRKSNPTRHYISDLFYIVQVRIYKRLLKFARGIKINGSSPFEVQSIIILPVNTVNRHSVPQWQGVFSDAD